MINNNTHVVQQQRHNNILVGYTPHIHPFLSRRRLKPLQRLRPRRLLPPRDPIRQPLHHPAIAQPLLLQRPLNQLLHIPPIIRGRLLAHVPLPPTREREPRHAHARHGHERHRARRRVVELRHALVRDVGRARVAEGADHASHVCARAQGVGRAACGVEPAGPCGGCSCARGEAAGHWGRRELRRVLRLLSVRLSSASDI